MGALAVLIWHQNEDAGLMLKNLLNPEQYEVHLVKDTGAAVEKALSRKLGYDVAIVGISGTEGKGLEGVRLLRKINNRLPIVVVSEDTSLEIERKVREQRIFYYLLSPIEPEELREVVKEAVGREKDKV